MGDGDAGKPLGQKVKDWFESEGYLLEFRVARAFEEQGFIAHQGHYLVEEPEGAAREIDVLANMDGELEKGGFLRVSRLGFGTTKTDWNQQRKTVLHSGKLTDWNSAFESENCAKTTSAEIRQLARELIAACTMASRK